MPGLWRSNASPVAVDFGVGVMKALQLSLGDSPGLVAAASLETPDELLDKDAERLAWQAVHLPAMLKGAGFKGKRAVCTVSATRTLVQHLQVPRVEGVSLNDAVKEQLRQTTGHDPGALILRTIEVVDVVRSGNRLVEVIAIAMPRDVVMTHVRAIKEAGLECVGVHSEHLATVRAFESITKRMADSDLTSLYLDMGYGTTKITMAHGPQLVFAKTIPIGGRHFDAVIAKEQECTISMARKRRCETGHLLTPAPSSAPTTVASGSTAGNSLMSSARGALTGTMVAHEPDTAHHTEHSRVHEVVEALTDELVMCVRYEQALFPQRKIGRTVFIGGEARQTELCKLVAKALRLPAQVADPMSRLRQKAPSDLKGFEKDIPQPGWTVPIGLCLMPTDL